MPVQQYTAQSHEWLAIGISAFLLALALVIAVYAYRRWTSSAPQRRFHQQLVDLSRLQDNAINGAMQEVTSPGLRDELTRLHGQYTRIMSLKGARDEFE